MFGPNGHFFYHKLINFTNYIGFGIFCYRDFNPRDSAFFKSRDFNLGIRDFFSVGILIPGILDFHPRNFRKIPGINTKFPEFVIFYPRDRDYFSRDGISRQKANSDLIDTPGLKSAIFCVTTNFFKL